MHEVIYLELTEWYEGDICWQPPEKQTRFDLEITYDEDIIEQIKDIAPDHFCFIEKENDIINWIQTNREANHRIEDCLLIGDTDTMDIQKAFNNHLNTLGGFSGTQYDLWHNIEYEDK